MQKEISLPHVAIVIVNKLIILQALFILLGCAQKTQHRETFQEIRGLSINREFILHKNNIEKRIEFLWAKPKGIGPWPAIVLMHGHQIGKRLGGEIYVQNGVLNAMTDRGYVAISVSIPGYGKSDGPPDHCGPFTQNAFIEVINHFRKLPFIKADKICIYGFSNGASTAAMVASKDDRISAVVLVGGIYDLVEAYPKLSNKIMVDYIDRETGSSEGAFKERSAFYHADNIRSPVLLLHGENDYVVGPYQAEALASKLRLNGVPVRLKVYQHTEHRIPFSEQMEEIYPFLEKYLK